MQDGQTVIQLEGVNHTTKTNWIPQDENKLKKTTCMYDFGMVS